MQLNFTDLVFKVAFIHCAIRLTVIAKVDYMRKQAGTGPSRRHI